MPQIETIHVQINTRDVSGAGTDGSLYLGVCGREFHLDTSADDLERGSSREYLLGNGSNVEDGSLNDPRKQLLLTENVEKFPVYLRFVPNSGGDRWSLQRAQVSFNDDFFPRWDTLEFISDVEGIWLGAEAGEIVHIPKHDDGGGPA
jgi:hypothetical protein